MNAIEHAINRLMFSDIPQEILEDGFADVAARRSRRRKAVTDAIKEKLIKQVIKPDLDSIGGVMVQVPLSGVKYDKLTDYSRIYVIPKKLTLGRSIVQVNRASLNVTSNYAEYAPGQSSSSAKTSGFESAVGAVMSSHSRIPHLTNAEIELLGDNVVKINDYQNFSVDISLECRVEYTENLIEIKRPYYQDFAELVNVACKAHLYRALALTMDRTRLEGGREFGRYREFVDQWSDHYQMYQDLINEKWGKILLLNDSARNNKHILRSGRVKV